jgi:hypothetical protein
MVSAAPVVLFGAARVASGSAMFVRLSCRQDTMADDQSFWEWRMIHVLISLPTQNPSHG